MIFGSNVIRSNIADSFRPPLMRTRCRQRGMVNLFASTDQVPFFPLFRHTSTCCEERSSSKLRPSPSGNKTPRSARDRSVHQHPLRAMLIAQAIFGGLERCPRNQVHRASPFVFSSIPPPPTFRVLFPHFSTVARHPPLVPPYTVFPHAPQIAGQVERSLTPVRFPKHFKHSRVITEHYPDSAQGHTDPRYVWFWGQTWKLPPNRNNVRIFKNWRKRNVHYPTL